MTEPLEHADLRGVLAVSFATVIWAITGPLVKIVAVPALVISFYRLWISVPALAVAAKASGRKIWTRPPKWALVGGLLFASHQVLFFQALKSTTVANVMIIGALQPALVAVVSMPLFKERVTRIQVVWMTVGIAGVVTVVAGSAGSPAWSGWGDFLAVLNIVAFTAYFLASKQARKDVDTTTYSLVMTTTAGLVMAVICIATAQPLMRYDVKEWIVVATIALIPGTMGHFAVNWAHPRVPAVTSSTILLGLPALSAAGAWIVLGESMTPAAIAGSLVAIIAIGAMIRADRNRARADELELESTAP